MVTMNDKDLEEKIFSLALVLYGQEEGIDETSHEHLMEILYQINPVRAREISQKVDAVNGVFYIASDDEEESEEES